MSQELSNPPLQSYTSAKEEPGLSTKDEKITCVTEVTSLPKYIRLHAEPQPAALVQPPMHPRGMLCCPE
jgi:hypothetical protein